jgi:hypothetical protein
MVYTAFVIACPYDHAASAAKLRSLGGEWAEVRARRLERAGT